MISFWSIINLQLYLLSSAGHTGGGGTGWTCHSHRCGWALVNTESDIMATRLGRITTSKYSIITILVMIGLIEVTRQYLDQQQQPKQRSSPVDVDSDLLSSVFPSTPKSAQNSSLFPSKLQSRSAPQRILLLAYARSGSSFTGELLSSAPSAAYYYEPLFRNLSCYHHQDTMRLNIAEKKLFTLVYLMLLADCLNLWNEPTWYLIIL